MSKWLLVADSSCDLDSSKVDFNGVSLETVPLRIMVDDKEFVDVPSTDPKEMLDAMKTAKTTSSSCPSPEDFAEKFRMADNIFAVTITQLRDSSSRGLSYRQGMPQNWISSTQQVMTNRPGANMPFLSRRSMATWALKQTVLPSYF